MNQASYKKYDLTSIEFKNDPHPTFRQMLEAGPVVRSRLPIIGKCWLVPRYDAVNELLRDQQRFVRDPKNAGRTMMAGIQWWMPKRLTRLANNMLAYDGEQHRRLRSLVDQAFQKNSVEHMQPRLIQITDQLLDELPCRVDQQGDVDVVTHFARQLPLNVICELLGLPLEDRNQFVEWFRQSLEIRSLMGLFRLVPGVGKLTRYLERQLEAVREKPRPGLMSELVQVELDGDRLSQDELLSMIFLLLVAGHETTVHLISSGLHALLSHPDQRQRLVNDWSQGRAAVDEILRYASPIQLAKPRMIAQPLEWCETRFVRGELMMPVLAAANVDPERFESPETFDIGRENASRHLTFGTGPHVCLGMLLARSETQIALERMLTRFPNMELSDRGIATRTRRLGVRGFHALPVRLNC